MISLEEFSKPEVRDRICTQVLHGDNYENRSENIRQNLLDQGFPECDIDTDDEFDDGDNVLALRRKAIEKNSVDFGHMLMDLSVPTSWGTWSEATSFDCKVWEMTDLACASEDMILYAACATLKPELMEDSSE